MRVWQSLPGFLTIGLITLSLGAGEPEALSPEESLKSIRVASGFEVELVVAEPLVEDPIAFAWGADGKLWVVEMGDYPLGIDGKGEPGGKIKFLESTHDDGKYDKATVFLDHLPFPTGVMPWHKGVLVTCAPEIFYAEDTTGGGKANLRVPLFTGFREGNQQHRVNSLVPGLDNWIYCANGHSGGKVISIKTGATVDISGRDLRIRPDEGLIEATSGMTQYGRARDDWGNWFGNDNSNPMFHFVLDDHYLRRNPSVATPQMSVPVSDHPGATRVYPISRTRARFNDLDAANHFTSACSAIVYRDNLFGAFSNSTFVSEPVHNLVHREVISPLGVTFTSHRAPEEETSEFFASSDNWVRPTMLQTGPDGALWVADMYRAVIEHPEWIPKDVQKTLDLRAGHDKGRIYRVFPAGHKPRPIPRLDGLDAAGLVAALDSPSGWQRDTAQRLLLDRHDASAIPLLKQRLLKSENPLCRLHSLCTLDGLSAADESIVRHALADAHPQVRRHAIRIAGPLLAKSPELGRTLVKLIDDADPNVRMQLAYSLGDWNDPEAGRALGRLALQNADDHFIPAAVMSSLGKSNIEAFASELMPGFSETPRLAGLLDGVTRSANALGGPRLTLRLMAAVASAGHDGYGAWRFEEFERMQNALEQAGTSLAKLAGSESQDARAELKMVESLFAAARATAEDAKAPLDARIAAVHLLGRGASGHEEDVKTLATFLSPQTPSELQTAAAETLARGRDPQTPALLLHSWSGYAPALRTRIIDALLSRQEWGSAVLDAIERHDVQPNEIDAPRRQRLLHHKDPATRARAGKLLLATNPNRTKVVESYADVLNLKGDAARGREVFAKNCAVCHRLGSVGASVGPDLASIGNKLPEGLLTSILDPNQAVEPRYVGYLVETQAGDSYLGVLAAESGNSITLAVPGGEQKSFVRSELKSLHGTGLSLMPEGLESVLAHQDLADLIAAIRAGAVQREPKKVQGNQPELVHADSDGVLHLLATNCEIYGRTLTLESRYGNLGMWTSDDDQAVWSADVPAAGTYAVMLHYACADASAGNSFILQCAQHDLPGIVPGTQSWDNYRRLSIGQIILPAGRQQITFRAAGKSNGALIDLTDVVLKPVK
jgi:putative membrane-bound dehydrogenase-like protein